MVELKSMESSECGKTGEKRKLKKLQKIFRHFALFVAVVVYTALGALVFQKLEHPAEISKLNRVATRVSEKRFRLIKFSSMCSTDWEKCSQFLDDYEIALVDACKEGLNLPLRSTAEISSKWSFLESAFFASTVLTTIGYGNTVPKTFWGRLFCILFAFVGIPLTLSVIADMGVLMATALSTVHQKTKRFLPNKNLVSLLSPSEVRWLSAMTGIIFFALYLSAGAVIFMIWEDDWGFFEGFYFCFITMTTIGFGDLVPGSPNYMFLCTLYILVGLALTSTIIELVRRQYARSWKTIQALTGPLAEMLKKMGDVSGPGIDMKIFQNDLKKILTAMNVPKKTETGKEWREAIDSVLHDMAVNSTKKKASQMNKQTQRHKFKFFELYSNTLVIFLCQLAFNRRDTTTRCRLHLEDKL